MCRYDPDQKCEEFGATHKCKWCATVFCKECKWGNWPRVMGPSDEIHCLICKQTKFVGEKVERIIEKPPEHWTVAFFGLNKEGDEGGDDEGEAKGKGGKKSGKKSGGKEKGGKKSGKKGKKGKKK